MYLHFTEYSYRCQELNQATGHPSVQGPVYSFRAQIWRQARLQLAQIFLLLFIFFFQGLVNQGPLFCCAWLKRQKDSIEENKNDKK